MLIYQDYEKVKDNEELKKAFIKRAINEHLASDMYKIASDAQTYDKQQNSTIMNYVKYIYNQSGLKSKDLIASNNKLCSNFFHRLNTQRCLYLLGNGVSFANKKTVIDEKGNSITIDTTKQQLGKDFDVDLKNLSYKSLIEGISFGYWDYDKLQVFSILEFVPLWDEKTSGLRAGIKFWRIGENKPLYIILFEEDGLTQYIEYAQKSSQLEILEQKKAYIRNIQETNEGDIVNIEYTNYPNFPIIPCWGSQLHQSTLIGMKGKIDAFDLIRSGFANDLEDCAEIYWILGGAGGMNGSDIAKFRSKLKLQHIAVVDTDESSATPYTQDIPYNARQVFLDSIRSGIYEDFGGLDVHTISATATNDHIDAAYQPLDEESDDFEYQIVIFIRNLLKLLNIDDMPIFTRNRISNQKELTDMILSAAEYLDEETVLQKLPFIEVDEIANILSKKDREMAEKYNDEEEEIPEEEPEEEPKEGILNE